METLESAALSASRIDGTEILLSSSVEGETSSFSVFRQYSFSREGNEANSSDDEENASTDKSNSRDDDEGDTANEYAQLGGNGEDEEEFEEFVTADSFTATALPNEVAISTVESNMEANDDARKETAREESHLDEIDDQESNPRNMLPSNALASNRIPPLTQEKIDIIKRAMNGLRISPRPGAELIFSAIEQRHYRLGDELKTSTDS